MIPLEFPPNLVNGWPVQLFLNKISSRFPNSEPTGNRVGISVGRWLRVAGVSEAPRNPICRSCLF